jgi:amidase
MAGVRMTLGTRALRDHEAATDSILVERLEAAGAIVLGKTNLPELGHKGTTDNLLFGPTSTPFAPGMNAGGSSGGSAAAVAAGLAAIAQGSDGGGSIRIPAALCGCFGLKPSFGRVPFATRPDAFYHTPFSSAGPLSRHVEDATLMLDVIAGPHDRDPFSLPTHLVDATRRHRIAYSPNLGSFPVSQEVLEVVESALDGFEGAHVEQVEVDLGHSHDELAELWKSQIAVVFAAADVDSDDLPPDMLDYIDRGRALSALDLKAGDIARTRVFDALQSLFERFDHVVTPTTCVASVPNGADGLTVGPSEIDGVPVDPLIGWCLTFPVNFTGHPAASMPAGLTTEGVPVGLQVIGRRFRDDSVLAACAAFERARPWGWMYERLQSRPEPEELNVV